MAIHYNLTIYERNGKGTVTFDHEQWRVINTAGYSHSSLEHPIKDEQMIHFEENRDIAIKFTSDHEEQTRLYIDALDYYNSDLCEEDDAGNAYIPPTRTLRYLFKNDGRYGRNSGSSYPFVPGRYRFYVQYGEEKDYFYLMVDPKSMNWTMLDEMRQEVENQVETMAHSLIESKAVVGAKDKDQEKGLLTAKIIQLCKHSDKICRLIQSIKNTPRYIVNNRYKLVSSEKASIIDHETIKYHLRHPEEKQLWLTPKRELSYAIPENIMIIQSIKYLHKTSKIVLRFIHSYLASTEIELKKPYQSSNHRLILQKENLEKQQLTIRRIIYSSVRFLEENWVKEIVHNHSNRLPGLQVDSRYRKLYEIYQLIKQEKNQLTLSVDYTYCWKRTDKVYELWGFIRTIKALVSEKIGFSPVDGWIYGHNVLNASATIPMLTEGTCVTFTSKRNSSSIIRLVYDQELPRQSFDTDFYHPLFTTNRHRKPDARLDCYQNGKYVASFIMDFKYRPASVIKAANSRNSQDKIFEQLNDYKHFESLYVGKDQDYRVPTDRYVWKRGYPIPQVWVMYPNLYNEKISEEEEGFVKIPYSPTDSMERLETMIHDAFEKCGIFL
ncbi:nuclease domain-containing protein [Sporolactobacillus inulinus]|uniref:nuclease domain-containing protein n=1 Tax=Sporolactobacillus inulinus TaxID=2078 RepID=UPI0011428A54|nr:nuclease domain-containing protein [Sporolactobacillus inulinus]GEB77774.1 hypothetical protein SIN01_21190 [Sporolactobacillus inulinus]